MNKYEEFYFENQQTTYNFKVRGIGIETFGWAVPNDEAINTCVKYSPLVEIGAGLGYWAHLITDAGGKVYAYDKDSQPLYFDVKKGTEKSIFNHPDCNLFLCWPPYNEPMGENCVNEFTGKYIIHVGEGDGCTGLYYEHLTKDFMLLDTIDIPQWWGLHDRMEVWKRNDR